MAGTIYTDYNLMDFEKDLGNGVNVEGKSVLLRVTDLTCDPIVGHIIHAGITKSLKLISEEKPQVIVGHWIAVTIDKVSDFGVILMTYNVGVEL